MIYKLEKIIKQKKIHITIHKYSYIQSKTFDFDLSERVIKYKLWIETWFLVCRVSQLWWHKHIFCFFLAPESDADSVCDAGAQR